eukprot:4364707-Amphidinium_carterae.7
MQTVMTAAVEPDLIPKLLVCVVSQDIPSLQQCLMPGAVEPLVQKFSEVLLQAKEAAATWTDYDYAPLMKLMADASTFATSSAITLAMYDLGEQIKKRDGEKSKSRLMALAKAVTDVRNREDGFDLEAFLAAVHELHQQLMSHSIFRDADTSTSMSSALTEVVRIMCMLFYQHGAANESLQVLKETAQVLAKCMGNVENTMEIDLVTKGMELEHANESLSKLLNDVVKKGADTSALLAACIGCKRLEQQVKHIRTVAHDLNTDLGQAVVNLQSNSEKVMTTGCAHEKKREAVVLYFRLVVLTDKTALGI